MGGGGPSERSGACYNRIRRPEALNRSKERPLCPSTNTFVKSAKPGLRRLSFTSSRKSPALSAPARRRASSSPSLPPPTAAAMELPPNPPAPPAAAEAAAVAAAVATKVGQPFLPVRIDDVEHRRLRVSCSRSPRANQEHHPLIA